MLPAPCLHSSHQRQQIAVFSLRKQANTEEKGGKCMHHSAHQTPGSAFFNPCLSPCPARSPATPPPPPPPPTLYLQPKAMRPGCAWQLATSPATNVFPKHPLPWPYQQIKPRYNPWWSVPLTFFFNVSTISGWLARHCILAMSAACVTLCVCILLYLLMYVWIYLRLFST